MKSHTIFGFDSIEKYCNCLVVNGKYFFLKGEIIEDNTLVAITIMIAESKPEEKETMVNLVMNFLE